MRMGRSKQELGLTSALNQIVVFLTGYTAWSTLTQVMLGIVKFEKFLFTKHLSKYCPDSSDDSVSLLLYEICNLPNQIRSNTDGLSSRLTFRLGGLGSSSSIVIFPHHRQSASSKLKSLHGANLVCCLQEKTQLATPTKRRTSRAGTNTSTAGLTQRSRVSNAHIQVLALRYVT